MTKEFFQWLNEVVSHGLRNDGDFYAWAWKEASGAAARGEAWELPPWNCKTGRAVQWRPA